MYFCTRATALLARVKKLAAPVFSANLTHRNVMLGGFTLPDFCQMTTALKHNADQLRPFVKPAPHRPAQMGRRAEMVRSIPDETTVLPIQSKASSEPHIDR
jgi:hypothetical protein